MPQPALFLFRGGLFSPRFHQRSAPILRDRRIKVVRGRAWAKRQRRFGFRETHVRGEASERLLSVHTPGGVHQDDRTGTHAVVRGRRSHDPRTSWNRARLPDAGWIPGIVSVVDSNVAAIGERRPKLLVMHG